MVTRNADFSPKQQKLLTLVGIGGLVLILGILSIKFQRSAQTLRATWPAETDTYYLPPSTILKLASLKHTELMADLLHARANVYFGTQLTSKLPTRWLANYLHTAIDLDPYFQRLYLSGSTMLIYNSQRITPEMVLSANEVLERGRRMFPLNWEIGFQLGFNYLFELPGSVAKNDARLPAWRQKGLEYLQEAALFENVPYFIPNLVARMLTQQGSDDLAIAHLERTYATTSNEQAREQIRRKLLSLRKGQTASRLQEAIRSFQQMLQSSYPYAPEAFSIVLGPRITAPPTLPDPGRIALPRP